MLAIIPIFTALFFIPKTPTGVPNRNTSSPGKIALRATGVRPSAFLRRFEPLATGSIPVGVPNRNRTCIKGLGNPRSIQLNYGDNALYFIHAFLILQVVITACIIPRTKIKERYKWVAD